MFRKGVYICLFALSGLIAENTGRSPEQIAQDLQKANQDFLIAEQMFIPWYTGPLITGSANNVPMGHVNLQPYLYLTENYGVFTNERHWHSAKHTYIVNPLLVFQVGVTQWLDATIIGQGIFKWRDGTSAQNYGDTSLQFGLQALKQTMTMPSIRFVVGEQFPTGRYQHLSSKKNGLDASGIGVCATIIGLNVSKIFWWWALHPVGARVSMNCVIPNYHAHVKNFNAWGGGFGTDGHTSIGTTFNGDLGLEVSLTQKWVFAIDFAYTYSGKTTFSGKPGTTVAGSPAAVGSPSSDNFSIAPAIEYNVSSSGGFIGGVWFSITGRNSANFVSVILSYTQMF